MGCLHDGGNRVVTSEKVALLKRPILWTATVGPHFQAESGGTQRQARWCFSLWITPNWYRVGTAEQKSHGHRRHPQWNAFLFFPRAFLISRVTFAQVVQKGDQIQWN